MGKSKRSSVPAAEAPRIQELSLRSGDRERGAEGKRPTLRALLRTPLPLPTAPGKPAADTQTTAFLTDLADALSTHLDAGRGEAMIYLGPHNLVDWDVESLFDSEHSDPGSAHDAVGLTAQEQSHAVALLTWAATEVGAELSMIWSAFDDLGKRRVAPEERAGSPGTAAINEADSIARWTAASSRL